MRIKTRSGRYPAVAITLLIAAVLLLLIVKPWGFQLKKERQILLRDPAKVDRIVITGPGGSVELLLSGEGWLLPGGEAARLISVENLLFTAGRLQVDAVRSDLSEWKRAAVKEVTFFSRKKPVLQYECLSRDERFLLRSEGSDKVYAVSLPGYPDLELDQVFSDSENHYRDHLLIDLLPKDIRQVEVEKRGNPPFIFARDEADLLSCKLPATDSLVPMELIDEEAVRMLFTYFTSISYEERAGELADPLTGGAGEERWLAKVSVESVDGVRHSLQVYSMPDEAGSAHMFKALVIYNNRPEALVVKYIYLDVLMRALPAYFGDNSLRH